MRTRSFGVVPISIIIITTISCKGHFIVMIYDTYTIIILYKRIFYYICIFRVKTVEINYLPYIQLNIKIHKRKTAHFIVLLWIIIIIRTRIFKQYFYYYFILIFLRVKCKNLKNKRFNLKKKKKKRNTNFIITCVVLCCPIYRPIYNPL